MLSPQPYPDPTPLQQPQASMHQYKKLPVNFEYRPVEQFNYPYVGPFAALPKSQPTERISASWENLHQLCSNSLVELVFSPPQPQTVLTADNQETVITKSLNFSFFPILFPSQSNENLFLQFHKAKNILHGWLITQNMPSLCSDTT